MTYFIYVFAGVYDYNDVRYLIAVTKIVPNILGFSSCLHVTLLVFMRLLAVRYPLSYKTLHKKLRHNAIISIWAITSLGEAIPLFVVPFSSKLIYSYVRLVLLNGFGTIPVISMVIMNVLFAWTVKKRKASTLNTSPSTAREFNETITRKTNLLVQKVVAFLLVSNTPYLVFANYYDINVFPRDVVKLTKIEVN